MNKLDVSPTALTVSPASFPRLEPARRLIVLVPPSGADTAATARKIWELANALECRVQFLGLSKDAAHEPGIRRQLVSLSTLVSESDVPVESKIEFGSNWLEIVKANRRAGDVIVCFTGQLSGLSRKPLNQLIETNLKATVYVLGGLYLTDPPRLNWLSTAMVWAGSLGIMAVFFWLQVKITQLPEDWVQTSFMYLSILVEVGLIWGWNTLFS